MEASRPHRPGWARLGEAREQVEAALANGDHEAALRRYTDLLADPVHRFFDEVYVNVEDADLRRNRLALCHAVWVLLAETVADLSRIVRPAGSTGGRAGSTGGGDG